MLASSPDLERLPADLRERIQASEHRQRLQNMRALARLQLVSDTMRSRGVDCIALKGVALSQWAYGDWNARGLSCDIDILVHPRKVQQAEQALEGLGLRQVGRGNIRSRRLRAYDLWLHYEHPWTSAGLGHVDLHWRPLPGGADWNSFEASWARRQSVDCSGVTVATLGRLDSLRMASAQGEEEHWKRLRRLADLWLIFNLCDEEERSVAQSTSSLVTQSLRHLRHRWDAITADREVSTTGLDELSSLWRIRRGSGSLHDSAARAALGLIAPVRRIQRVPRSPRDPLPIAPEGLG